MKSKDLQPRLLYPAKLSFRIKRQIKSCPDKKIKNINNKLVITTYLSKITLNVSRVNGPIKRYMVAE